MAKYSRFDPSNKKKSRDKNNSLTEKNRNNKVRKSERPADLDWEEYEDKYNLQNLMKNMK